MENKTSVITMIKKLNLATFTISSVLLLFMALSVSADAVLRYVFNSPSTWVNEISGYLLVVMTFLAIGHTLLLGGHVRMDMLYHKVSPKKQIILYCISYVLVFIYASVFFYYALNMTLASFSMGWKSSTILAIPFYLPQMFMPIGLLLLILETIVLFYEKIMEYKKISSVE